MPGNAEPLHVERVDDVTHVSLTDESLLEEQAQATGEQLFNLADQLYHNWLLLDFANVLYLSSAALAKLVALNKKVHDACSQLILCNVDSAVYEVFEITKLDKVFQICPSKDDPGGACGGVGARLKPPRPSGGAYVALQPPAPDGDN